MGNCGSDLVQQMGPQFAQLVATEKGKVFVDTKINEIKNKVSKLSLENKNQILRKIDDQENISINQVRQAVQDIDRKSPGALENAAKVQRKSKESVLGLDQIRGQFNSVRQQVETLYSNQENTILTEINNQGLKQKQLVDSQRPKIPVYDQLPENQKRKVFEEGEKKFSEQIKAKQTQIQRQIQSSLNINSYEQKFKSLQKNISIQGVTQNAEKLIETAKGGLSQTTLFC